MIGLTNVEAQISNLANLANGEMQMFTPIFEENQDVYGYFTLFKLDKLNENEEKYEYTILDKNLNKVANGEFVDVATRKFILDIILQKNWAALYFLLNDIIIQQGG
nr:DUF6770 family protein [Jejuia pallidilutea]